MLWDNEDPVMGLDPDTMGLDPDTNDIEEEINMDSFDLGEEQNIEIDEGGQLMGV